MDLQDVRKFVRKGDDASKLLESLGYSYESYQSAPPKWIKVKEDPLAPIVASVEKLLGDLQAPLLAKIKEMKAESQVLKVGDCFSVGDIRYVPASHKFRLNEVLWRGRKFVARSVENHLTYGQIVRFGFNSENTGYWLPVKAVDKR